MLRFVQQYSLRGKVISYQYFVHYVSIQCGDHDIPHEVSQGSVHQFHEGQENAQYVICIVNVVYLC